MNSCNKCSKSFSKKSNLNRHLKLVHNENIAYAKSVRPYQCLEGCEISFRCNKDLLKHLTDNHSFKLEVEELQFSSIEDFYSFLNQIQSAQHIQYVQLTGKKHGTSKDVIYFKCNRSVKSNKKQPNQNIFCIIFMGLVKAEYSWSRRIYRSDIQSSIFQFQWVLESRVSVHRGSPAFFVFLILFSIYAQSPTMAEENKQLTAVLQGNGLFTRNFYQILAKEKNKNIFFSPISIHAILSLAAQGSGGKTKKAFTDSLQVSDLVTLAEGYKEAMKQLNSVKDVTLLMANKVYIKEKYSLQDAFKQVVTTNFLSEVQSIDFSQNAAAAKTINSWVEEKTQNKIKDLIKSGDLDSDTRLVLVNAIYFKGKWAEPFKPSETKTEKFYLNDTDTMDVQMMHLKKKFFYKNDEALDAKVLELPYTNKDLSMIIILPNKRNGIEELEAKLANTDLTKITENMRRPEVIVALPKFKIETKIDLNDPLSELGLGEIFSNSADFSGMLQSPEGLKVSKVIHKAFIEVNEEGAEAAAATGMRIMKRSLPHIEEFICNHPFLVQLIQKNSSESKQINLLFKGKIYHPDQAHNHDEL